jgi:hypothetical protein
MNDTNFNYKFLFTILAMHQMHKMAEKYDTQYTKPIFENLMTLGNKLYSVFRTLAIVGIIMFIIFAFFVFNIGIKGLQRVLTSDSTLIDSINIPDQLNFNNNNNAELQEFDVADITDDIILIENLNGINQEDSEEQVIDTNNLEMNHESEVLALGDEIKNVEIKIDINKKKQDEVSHFIHHIDSCNETDIKLETNKQYLNNNEQNNDPDSSDHETEETTQNSNSNSKIITIK